MDAHIYPFYRLFVCVIEQNKNMFNNMNKMSCFACLYEKCRYNESDCGTNDLKILFLIESFNYSKEELNSFNIYKKEKIYNRSFGCDDGVVYRKVR
jgi:hypothetical protein